MIYHEVLKWIQDDAACVNLLAAIVFGVSRETLRMRSGWHFWNY